MNENILPPLVNYKNLDPECNLNFVTDINEYETKYMLKKFFGIWWTQRHFSYKEVLK